MDNLPKDPFMLLSAVNMKLRDAYPSLEELGASLDIDRRQLERTLADAGFTYSAEHNRFW